MSRPPQQLTASRTGLVRAALADVTGLLLPIACAGCGAWDRALCSECERLLRTTPRRCEAGAAAVAGLPGGAPLPTWCVADYVGVVPGIVLTWKGRGDRAVAGAMARAGRLAGQRWRPELEGASLVPDADLVVVPAPSGWRRRASGRLVVRALAVEVAGGLADVSRSPHGDGATSDEQVGRPGRPRHGRDLVRVCDVLRRGTGRAHQAGLGASGRSVNRRRSMRLAADLPDASSCLLVDDVLTTGATLAECRRALESAGHRVLAALVLAATPAPSSRQGARAW